MTYIDIQSAVTSGQMLASEFNEVVKSMSDEQVEAMLEKIMARVPQDSTQYLVSQRR